MSSKTAQPPAEQPSAPPPGPEMARVRDTLVQPGAKARQHDIAGRVYSFGYDEYVEMPMEAARTVAHIPEFEVLHANGARILVDKGKPVQVGAISTALRSDQVVAAIDELSDTALAARARAIGYRGPPEDLAAMRRLLMQAAAEDAERALGAKVQRRKLLVNGVVTEVEFDGSGKPILGDARESFDRETSYTVEDVDLAAVFADQQRQRDQAARFGR